jgi:hypothetical protein
MNDATIELAQVDEDILGYEFSDEAIGPPLDEQRHRGGVRSRH